MATDVGSGLGARVGAAGVEAKASRRRLEPAGPVSRTPSGSTVLTIQSPSGVPEAAMMVLPPGPTKIASLSIPSMITPESRNVASWAFVGLAACGGRRLGLKSGRARIVAARAGGAALVTLEKFCRLTARRSVGIMTDDSVASGPCHSSAAASPARPQKRAARGSRRIIRNRAWSAKGTAPCPDSLQPQLAGKERLAVTGRRRRTQARPISPVSRMAAAGGSGTGVEVAPVVIDAPGVDS